MNDDEPATNPPVEKFLGISTQKFSRVAFDALNEWERARLIGAIIMRRHFIHRTIDQLTALKDERLLLRKLKAGITESAAGASDAKDNARSSCVPMLILHTMAALGEMREHSAGLMVYASRDEIAVAAGVAKNSTYLSLRDLAAVGAVRAVKRGKNLEDWFELFMPQMTAEEMTEADPEEPEARAKHKEGARQAIGGRAPSITVDACAPTLDITKTEQKSTWRAPSIRPDACAPTSTMLGARPDKTAAENPHFWPENRGARQASDPPDLIRSDLTSDLISDQGDNTPASSWEEQAMELLVGNGMLMGNAKALASHQNCTPAQLQIAIDHLTHRRKKRMPHHAAALLTDAIKKKWGPLESDERFGERSKPENVQESNTAEAIKARTERDEERRAEEAVQSLPSERRTLLIQQAIAMQPDDTTGQMFKRMYGECLRGKPLMRSLKLWMYEQLHKPTPAVAETESEAGR